MHLIASDFYTYFRPSKCDLRIYLKHVGAKEAEPSPYEQVLRRLGERHEKAHLASLPPCVDLSSLPAQQREAKTIDEIRNGSAVIYQPLLRTEANIGGQNCEIVGNPDFLIAGKNGQYLIRDSKMSRRITEEDHPEILLQLELYGWLYEKALGRPPVGLQVHSGTGDIVDVPYQRGGGALAVLEHIVSVRQATAEPYSPVGWSKCGTCTFQELCWKRAEDQRDVAIVEGVDQGLAIALRQAGINTIRDLLSRFGEADLAAFERPWGKRTQRVGNRAASILRMAKAMHTSTEIQIQPPQIPSCDNWVMFDLEGLPPQLDETEKIYLWGMQVFGCKPSPYSAATAGFGPDGDREGWEEFLRNAEFVFRTYGDIPFVHWASYEKTYLKKYIDRFADRGAIADRVLKNLLDLLPITKDSIALPLPSYSLKVVEGHVGFSRSQEEYGGDWAMAKYIEAVETHDESHRAQLMKDILKYNEEDLQATWAVLQWLRQKSRA